MMALNQAITGARGRNTPWKCHQSITGHPNLESRHDSLSLDCGRKLGNSDKTHINMAKRCKLNPKRPQTRYLICNLVFHFFLKKEKIIKENVNYTGLYVTHVQAAATVTGAR